QAANDFFQVRSAIRGVELERIRIAAEDPEPAEVEQQLLLGAAGAVLDRERESEVVEDVVQHRLAGADHALFLELEIDARQGDRIVERVMRAADVDAEPRREILEFSRIL